jgi:hypothetical protein
VAIEVGKLARNEAALTPVVRYLMRSQLFRGVDHEERCAEAADAWRLALIQKGFTELSP